MKESLATLGVSTSRKRPADELSLAESVDRVQGDANLSFEKLVIGPIILHFFLIIQSFNIFFSISKFQYFLFPSFKVSVNFFFFPSSFKFSQFGLSLDIIIKNSCC